MKGSSGRELARAVRTPELAARAHDPRHDHVPQPVRAVSIEHGRLLRRNMRHELITHDELMSHLREHGVTDPSQVEKACMESDGEVTVIKKRGFTPSAPATSPR